MESQVAGTETGGVPGHQRTHALPGPVPSQPHAGAGRLEEIKARSLRNSDPMFLDYLSFCPSDLSSYLLRRYQIKRGFGHRREGQLLFPCSKSSRWWTRA